MDSGNIFRTSPQQVADFMSKEKVRFLKTQSNSDIFFGCQNDTSHERLEAARKQATELPENQKLW